MRLPRLCCFIAPLCLVGPTRAASVEAQVAAPIRPLLGERMALSPDGQRVAYTVQKGPELSIVILDIERLGPRRTVPAAPERDSAAGVDVAPPTRLRFLRWATPTRLVFAPEERVVPVPPTLDKDGRPQPSVDGPTILSPILAVDADGKQRATLVDAKDFTETPADARRSLADLLRSPKELAATRAEPVGWRMPHLDILGFLPRDREQLVLQTRGGYSIPTQHLVDLRTGTVREFADWPVPPGEPHIFDEYRLKIVGEKAATRPTIAWRDEDLARLQQMLETKFPRRTVEILDWSETRARVLFQVTGGSDSARVFVYQRPEDLALEILRRAPGMRGATEVK